MIEMLQNARSVKSDIARLSEEQKNNALHAMADALVAATDAILAANALDLEAAKETISSVMLDRLRLSTERIDGMAKGIREVAQLPDPVGLLLDEHTRADGLKIQKVSVPMGQFQLIEGSEATVCCANKTSFASKTSLQPSLSTVHCPLKS